MANIFIYGTLCYRPLLDIVLGSTGHLTFQDVTLDDHRVVWARGECFPIIVHAGGAKAVGILMSGLTEQDIARLDFYEGGFDYTLQERNVRGADGVQVAKVYFPGEGTWLAGAAWSLQDWIDEWGQMTLFAAQEVMGLFGRRSVDDIAAMFPQIRQRAASRVRADAKTVPSRFRPSLDRSLVAVTSTVQPYVNYFAVQEQELTFQKFNGAKSEPVSRAAFVGGDAVVVLPYDPVRDRVLIISQFRFGPFVRGDNRPWSLEPVAGRIDAGESPEDAAHREVMEETGLRIRKLIPIANYYPSAGAFTEYLYSYLGLTDLADGAATISGLDTEAEDIKGYVVDFQELMGLISCGEVEDAQLILSAFWLAGQRDLIRQTA